MWQLADGRTCGQTGYIIWGGPMQNESAGPLFKTCEEIQGSDSRAFNQGSF